MRTSPPRRRDEARALFRNGILDAAERVFADRGFHGARIQDIAEAARTAVGTVYNHFAQKEDILRALFDEHTDALLAQLRPAADDPPEFGARLTGRLRRLLEFVEQHRGFFTIAMESGLTAEPPNETTKALVGRSARRLERFRAAFLALVDEGLACGALAHHDRGDLAAFLAATVRTFSMRELADGRCNLANKAELMVELFLRGAGRFPEHADGRTARRRRSR